MESSGQIYVTRITFVIYETYKSYIAYAIHSNVYSRQSTPNGQCTKPSASLKRNISE